MGRVGRTIELSGRSDISLLALPIRRVLIAEPVLPYVWMLLGALAFSAMATLAHALGPTCDWQLVATVRTALALTFATALALRAGAKLVFIRPPTLWIRSLAGTVSLVCTFYALPRMPIADVLTLTNVFPMWVALLSWPLLGERPAKETWLAIAVGMCGVVLVAQPHFSSDDGLAAIVALISSFSTAISMLGLHRLQHVDPRAIVAHFSGVSLTACFAMLLLTPAAPMEGAQFGVDTVLMLLGVGIAATTGQLFLTKAFAAGPPAKVSVVALTQVGFALMFDRIFWDHTLSLLSLAGIVLVMAPTAWLLLTQGRPQVDDL